MEKTIAKEETLLEYELDKINSWQFIEIVKIDNKQFPVFKMKNDLKVIVGLPEDWALLEEKTGADGFTCCAFTEEEINSIDWRFKKYSYFILHQEEKL